MTNHAFLSGKSCLALAGFFAFSYYLGTAHKGPWTNKFDPAPLTYEAYKDVPQITSMFKPESQLRNYEVVAPKLD